MTDNLAKSATPLEDFQSSSYDWSRKPAAARKARILEIARRNEPRPGPYSSLGRSLAFYTDPGRTAYDPAFTKSVRSLRPEWFS